MTALRRTALRKTADLLSVPLIAIAFGIALAVVPISVRAETKVGGAAAPQSTPTVTMGRCTPSRSSAELGRTDTPDRACAGTCSGADAASLGYDRANSHAADRGRRGAHRDAITIGCRTDAGAFAVCGLNATSQTRSQRCDGDWGPLVTMLLRCPCCAARNRHRRL
jgi:hypothetical protein